MQHRHHQEDPRPPEGGEDDVVCLVFLLRFLWLVVHAEGCRAPCRCRHCRGLAGPDSDRGLPSPGRRGRWSSSLVAAYGCRTANQISCSSSVLDGATVPASRQRAPPGMHCSLHCGKLMVPAVVAPATYGPAVALISVDGSMEGFRNRSLTVPAGTPRMRPIAAQLLPSSRSLAASSRRKMRRGLPQCLPAACAFFAPATTLCTIIPLSSSLKADITEVMDRPISELASALSAWEVASHATP